MPGITPKHPSKPGEKSAEDIAEMDAKGYDDPGRDMLATKPVDPEDDNFAGRGDVSNPVAQTDSNANNDPLDYQFGSDEKNDLITNKKKGGP